MPYTVCTCGAVIDQTAGHVRVHADLLMCERVNVRVYVHMRAMCAGT